MEKRLDARRRLRIICGEAIRAAGRKRAAARVQAQAAGADAAGLLGRAGLSNPFRWDALNGQWQGVFPTLPATCTVTVHVDQGR